MVYPPPNTHTNRKEHLALIRIFVTVSFHILAFHNLIVSYSILETPIGNRNCGLLENLVILIDAERPLPVADNLMSWRSLK